MTLATVAAAAAARIDEEWDKVAGLAVRTFGLEVPLTTGDAAPELDRRGVLIARTQGVPTRRGVSDIIRAGPLPILGKCFWVGSTGVGGLEHRVVADETRAGAGISTSPSAEVPSELSMTHFSSVKFVATTAGDESKVSAASSVVTSFRSSAIAVALRISML